MSHGQGRTLGGVWGGVKPPSVRKAEKSVQINLRIEEKVGPI